MSPINRSMRPLEWLLLIILSILWGGSFFFVGVAVASLPPFTLVALRVGIAAITLNLIAAVSGIKLVFSSRLWFTFFSMGLLNNVIPFTLIVWGQTYLASGLAAILNAMTPFFTIIVAHAFTSDEKLTQTRLVGLVIGFFGVIVLIGSDLLHNQDGNALAPFAVLGGAFSYAVAGVYGRRFSRMGLNPLAVASGQLTASTVILLPIALAVDRPWTLPPPAGDAWGAVIGLALLSTALAYLLYFRILATAGATNLLLVTFLIPVSAILLGTALLGEQLLPRQIIGMVILGLGLATIDGRLIPRFRQWIIGLTGLAYRSTRH